jgi:hypothetical protein
MPDADIEFGHRLDLDLVRPIQLRPQPPGGLGRHRRAEADQVAVQVDVRALAQLVRRIADPPGQPAGPRPGQRSQRTSASST